MNIEHTKSYTKFRLLNGNRPIQSSKVKNLINEAKNGLNLFPYCPIIVYKENETLVIIDGQHRFTASKEMNSPIYYVICDKISLTQIAKLNSNSTNWSSKNFLECYIKTGLTDYEDIDFLIKKYKIAYAVAVDLLMHGNFKSKGKNMKNFKEGTFKSKYKDQVCALLDEVEEVFGRYEFWNHGYLIEAYRIIKEAGKFDKKQLKQKIKSAPNILHKRHSYKEYLFTIERVYNDKLQNRVSIF